MRVVLFALDGAVYALAATNVLEVTTPVAVTPLPFLPNYVDGLVGVGGQVVTQLDLSRRLGGQGHLSAAEGELLLVRSRGVPYALHIHRVLTLTTVPELGPPREAPAPETAAGNLVLGEFAWNGNNVLLLDVEGIGLEMLTPQGLPSGDEVGLLGVESVPSLVADQRLAALVVVVGRERFAFRLEQVQEIVEGVAITPLPHAPPEVLGITFLRHTPVLALSLNHLMGVNERPTQMVVVTWQEHRLGMLVDRVQGIERFTQEQCHPAHDHEGALAHYLLGRTQTMIGLIHMDGLLAPSRWARYRPYLPKRTTDAMVARQAEVEVVEPFLAFQVGREQCLLPLGVVELVTEFKPYDPLEAGHNRWLNGVVQIQGTVLPVVDLRLRFHSSAEETLHTSYLVVKLGEHAWALVVDRVFRVITIAPCHLETAERDEQALVRAVGRLNGVIYAVLSVEPLLQAA